jgi:hypothetical protein
MKTNTQFGGEELRPVAPVRPKQRLSTGKVRHAGRLAFSLVKVKSPGPLLAQSPYCGQCPRCDFLRSYDGHNDRSHSSIMLRHSALLSLSDTETRRSLP